MYRIRSLGSLFSLALSLLLVACASSSSSSSTAASSPSAAPAFPVTIEAANGPVTIESAPTKVVSISPTATEMLFAIGAGDQVVAADSYSDYPAAAPTTDLSAYEPNVEAIAAYDPDLVVYSDDLGDLQKSLDKLHIPALQQPAAAAIDDVYAQLEQLGQATGRTTEAQAQIDDLQAKVAAVSASVGDQGSGMTYYYELDDTYYSVTSDTFIGNLLGLLGMKNIADEAKGASSGYPQLSAEYIVAADPELVLLADTKCCGQDAASVAERPGWADLKAVQHDGVVELDDDIASRWGPRIVQLLQEVGDAVQEQAAA
ncbi:MAG: ABC transporter substrate-binding protein [Actinomycetota bacterium]